MLTISSVSRELSGLTIHSPLPKIALYHVFLQEVYLHIPRGCDYNSERVSVNSEDAIHGILEIFPIPLRTIID
jgi:hypothetical protein